MHTYGQMIKGKFFKTKNAISLALSLSTASGLVGLPLETFSIFIVLVVTSIF